MSLTVVATPIGDFGDITLRAIETLKSCDVLICEELKPARVLLKRIGFENISSKDMRQLNEHSKSEDVKELLELCRNKNVALISDCGTPGFCDPGADLVAACLKEKTAVNANPGTSSLMTLISLSGIKLKEFYFVGFLPAENTEREKKILEISKLKMPLVIMDTPYRLNKTLQELKEVFGNRQGILGMDLTGEEHRIEYSSLSQMAASQWPKTPFVLIIRAA